MNAHGVNRIWTVSRTKAAAASLPFGKCTSSEIVTRLVLMVGMAASAQPQLQIVVAFCSQPNACVENMKKESDTMHAALCSTGKSRLHGTNKPDCAGRCVVQTRVVWT